MSFLREGVHVFSQDTHISLGLILLTAASVICNQRTGISVSLERLFEQEISVSLEKVFAQVTCISLELGLLTAASVICNQRTGNICFS